MSEPRLRVEGLCVSLSTPRGPRLAVEDVGLEIQAGETLALVGESGSGKSMVAYAIMGLLPRGGQRASGTIRAGEDLISDYGDRAMRSVRGSRIGMIFQEPFTALNPTMRAGHQVTEAISGSHGEDPATSRRRACALFEEVGLPEPDRVFDSFPHQLSGGMRQRVVIAMALAGDPEILIADEPTTALDVTVQARVLETLHQIGSRRGLATLFITHDLSILGSTADRIAVMYSGRIVEQGPAAALLQHPRHPYTRGLLRALGAPDPKTRLFEAIPGVVPRLGFEPGGCRFNPRCHVADSGCTAAVPTLTEGLACFHPFTEGG